jgi:hypothetical protein
MPNWIIFVDFSMIRRSDMVIYPNPEVNPPFMTTPWAEFDQRCYGPYPMLGALPGIPDFPTTIVDRSRPPRPRNPWIMFRADRHHLEVQKNPGKFSNNELCKSISLFLDISLIILAVIIANQWKNAPPATKLYYKGLAEKEKIAHALKYPGYVYTPSERVRRVSKQMIAKANGEPANLPSLELQQKLHEDNIAEGIIPKDTPFVPQLPKA